MAILFDWYEDPKPSDKQQGENENTLHPRIKYNGSTGTDVLRRRIQERCSLTCLLYTSPSPRDTERSRMPSSA